MNKTRTSRLQWMAGMGLGWIVGLSQAAVSLPNGVYSDSVTDLQVKVQGGPIRISRDYVDGHWELNNRWNSLKFEYDDLDGSVKVIDRSGGKYEKIGDTWTLDTRFVIRQSTVSVLPAAPDSLPVAGKPGAGGQLLGSVPGYRWQNRTGDWVEYDKEGRISSYGDRNDNRVWFQYDSNKQLRYLLDHQGRVAMVYRWQSGQVSQICDNPGLIAGNTDAARCVGYSWSGTTNTTPAWPLLVKATDANGNATTYSYENGLIKTITDAENRVRTFSYLGERVVKLVEPDGATTQYSYDYDKVKRQFYIKQTHPQTEAGKAIEEYWYDSEGFLIRRDLNGQTQSTQLIDSRTRTSKDAAGNATITTLDEYNNPIKVQYADGSLTTARYSAAHGQIVEETDELGVKTSYDYDAKGNLLKKTEAVGLPEQRVTSYTYDAYGRQLSMTRHGGSYALPNGESVTVADATTRYEYDDFDNVQRKIDAENNVQTYKYNTRGLVVEMIDARKLKWINEYDGVGQLIKNLDPVGYGVQFSYDKTGKVLAKSDSTGNATRYSINNRGMVVNIFDPVGGFVRRDYDAEGRYIASADGGGYSELRKYGVDGLLAEVVDGGGNSSKYNYVQNGLLGEIVYPTYSRQFLYDARLRNSKIIDKLSGVDSYSQSFKYNSRGELVELIDRNGNLTKLFYDALGRIVKVVGVGGEESVLVYDSGNYLLAFADSMAGVTKYSYDNLGRKIIEVDVAGCERRQSYDGNGNLIYVSDCNGGFHRYSYDDSNRIVEGVHIAAGSAKPSRVIAYSYNAAGQLTGYSEQNADGVNLAATYTLDALGRKTAETTSYGNLSFITATSYHPTGRKASQTWPSGFKASYSYDAGQVLQGIDLGSAGSISVNQTRWNQPTKITYPGGSSRTIDYDALMRSVGIKFSDPGQSTLLDYRYGYDAESNILKKDTEHGQYDYGYDQSYRLTRVTAPSGLPNEAYSYDKVGNRLTDSRRSGDWVYEHNRLKQGRTLSGEVINYSYDANGSLIKKQSPSGLLEDNQQFVYDASNRLVAVQDSAGQTIARYQYDPFNRRISKTLLRDAQNQALPAPVTTYYLYGDEGLIAEADQNGQITAEYGWKPKALWGTDPQWLRTTRVGSSAPELLIYQNDHLGTPQQLIDVQGKSVWLARATAFGETTVKTDKVVNNLRFPGQYYDAETNTHYNYHRDYAPNLGRYVQSDPIGLKGGHNLYAYGGGNPISRFDFSGRDIWVTGEGGVTAHAILVGAGLSLGAALNVQTGESCPYIMICGRVGFGFQLSGGAKVGAQNGAHCGKDLSGFQVQVCIETIFGVGVGGCIDPRGPGAGRGVGPSVGEGGSIAVEFCWMQIASRACKNTPCECKEPVPCDCKKN